MSSLLGNFTLLAEEPKSRETWGEVTTARIILAEGLISRITLAEGTKSRITLAEGPISRIHEHTYQHCILSQKLIEIKRILW